MCPLVALQKGDKELHEILEVELLNWGTLEAAATFTKLLSATMLVLEVLLRFEVFKVGY